MRRTLPLCVQPGPDASSTRLADAARDRESGDHQISNTPSDICRSLNAEEQSVPFRHLVVQSCRANYPMKRVAQSSSGIDLIFARSASGFESMIDIVPLTGSMKSDFKSSPAALKRSPREVAMRNATEDPAAGRSYAARQADDRDRGTSGGAGWPQVRRRVRGGSLLIASEVFRWRSRSYEN